MAGLRRYKLAEPVVKKVLRQRRHQRHRTLELGIEQCEHVGFRLQRSKALFTFERKNAGAGKRVIGIRQRQKQTLSTRPEVQCTMIEPARAIGSWRNYQLLVAMAHELLVIICSLAAVHLLSHCRESPI